LRLVACEGAARRILEGCVEREALAAMPGIARALLPPAPFLGALGANGYGPDGESG